MSNRFCNLNAPALIKDDFKNISTGFDKVQLEIDDIVLSDHNAKTSTIKAKTFTSVDDRIEEAETDTKTDKENIAALQEDVTGLLTSETNSKTSIIKAKTFTSVDARIEETETDVKTDKENITTLQTKVTNLTLPATNLVVDGNFTSTTGWTTVSGVLSTLNNSLINTGDGSASSVQSYQTPMSLIAGHLYYTKVKARVTNSSCTSMVLHYRDTISQIVTTLNNPVANQWYDLAGIFSPVTSSTLSRINFLTTYYADMATANGKTTEQQYAFAIDLTATFGMGKEPRKETIEFLLSKYPNSWFNGTVLDLISVNDTHRNAMNSVSPATNLISNGNFASGVTGYEVTFASVISTVNNECVFIATASGGRVRASCQLLENHRYYMSISFKASSNLVRIDISGFPLQYHSGNNTYEKYSAVRMETVSISASFGIRDTGTSGWSNVSVKYILVLDLTAIFGAGNEPSASAMDYLLSKYPNSWFDGTVTNLIESNTSNRYAHGMLIPATNLISNGNFTSTLGWSANKGTATVTNNTYSITGDGTGSAVFMYQNLTPVVTGKRFHVRIKARVTNSNCTQLISYLGDSVHGSVSGTQTISTPVINTWYYFSYTIDITSSWSGLFRVYLQDSYADAATASGKVMEVQYISVIDLTNIFGAGYEPTASEMDLMLTKFPNGWFDGTVNPLLTHVELANYFKKRLDLKADIAQPAWISPTLLNGWIAFDATNYRVGYFKDSLGFVHVEISLKSGIVGMSAMTLPVGYRPARIINQSAVTSGSTVGYTSIAIDGSVIPNGINAQKTFCSGHIVFKAEA